MEVLEQIELDMRELLIRIEEARNLLYNGREIPCDRKLQGAQVKGNTIINALTNLRTGNTDGIMAYQGDKKGEEGEETPQY